MTYQLEHRVSVVSARRCIGPSRGTPTRFWNWEGERQELIITLNLQNNDDGLNLIQK